MRYPNHIILDVSRFQNSNITSNWTTSYRSFISKQQQFNNTLNIISNIKLSTKSIINKNESTVKIINSSTFFNTKSNKNLNHKTNNLLWSLFDINFLKKEKIYTKLKYSRSPQYDIVSGGVAALFAGFLGFLISEKFGIELVDSGDFYTFFMYIVFLCFATRPFLRIMSKKNTMYHFFSLKFVIEYTYTLLILSLHFLSRNSPYNNSIISSFKKINDFIKNNEYFSTIIKSYSKLINFLKQYPLQK